MPAGRDCWISGSSARTPAATSSGLADGVWKMPRNTPSSPLKRTRVSFDAAASSTRATSRSRTTSSPFERIGRAPNVSASCSVVFASIE